ncbi:thermostable hemolysin [Microbulbifer aggregans]|uniref:thermostable hemolysin n=1 Tax=Microbulbifer aggregans TaxID=1769779 RepID=UPI001CFE33EA|nr:thermostable hemolysin [Microbulbifer aggregans]
MEVLKTPESQSVPGRYGAIISRSGRSGFQLTKSADSERLALECYIAHCFDNAYGANLKSFLPLLLAYGEGRDFHSALGMRRADSGTLFLEQYLDEPVEACLSAAAGTQVTRAQIVEIGNLVSSTRGSSRMLFLMLAELMAAADLTWAIFTATPEVHRLLQKLTDNQLSLCRADGTRLGTALADWGSYYDTRPVVTAINVAAERERLLQRPLVGELLEACRPQSEALAPILRGHHPCN